jgi:glycosyltransferase involved in cell wall biosynthesis
MKKVAIFKPDLLPYSETFIRDQALSLRQWHPVLLGFRRVPGGLPLNGLRVKLLASANRRPASQILEPLRYWLRLPSPQAVRTLKHLNADLVHAHFGTEAVDVWPAVRAAGLPMLVTLHGYDINIRRTWWESGHGGLRRRVYPRRLLALGLEPRVRFIAVSAALRDRAIAFGIPPEKITVSYTGVNTAQFRPRGMPIEHRPKQVLFVGRLVEKKGVEYLLRAFEQIRREIPDAELVIAGDGSRRKRLEALAKSLDVPVKFVGAIGRPEVQEQLARSRVLCLPSVSAVNGDAEGFGQVLLEAQASGVPAVSSAFGGAAEGLLHGHTGFRVAERDVDQLADRVSTLLQDERLTARFAMNAIEWVRSHFAMASCAARLERHYDALATLPVWQSRGQPC